MSLMHPKRLGLIAGEGQLPVHVAQNAYQHGFEVVSFTLAKNNRGPLKDLCQGRLHPIVPGLINNTLALLKQEGIAQVVFAGKVNKWILLKRPQLDERALQLLKSMAQKNDDAVMECVIQALQQEGIEVLPQTDFLRNLFLPPGVLTQHTPSPQDLADIHYGFKLAKEMGRLDVGQTLVVKDGMILAVEAIEGTDECLKRAGQWADKKGGVAIKVAKPCQDQRFDVPTVGLRTLQTMKKAGLHLLATEARETLYLEPEEMIAFANRHGMILTSVEAPNES